MTTYTLASIPSRFTATQILNDVAFVSLSGATQTTGRTGNRWSLSLSFENFVGAGRRILESELRRLSGQRHRLQIQILPSWGFANRGNMGGAPLLNGGHSAGATSLVCDGFPASTIVLKQGDWFSLANEWKEATADVTSDGSGNATIPIWPEVHKNYADNQALSYTPAGVFICTTPIAAMLAPYRSNDWVTSIDCDFVEDVLA